MHTLLSLVKRTSFYGAILVLTGVIPMFTSSSVFADSSSTTPPCVAPSSSTPGVHVPTGADAGTFTYQCDGPYAGEWTNAYYVYDPVTGLRSPTYDLGYQYDCNTGIWTRNNWTYSPATGTFSESRIQTTSPGLPTNCPPPPSTTSDSGAGGSSISNTGPGSTNGVSTDTTLNGTTSNTTNLGMNNVLVSNAASGNAIVVGNTTGGSATSGDAAALATIANILQSTSNVFGPNTSTFVADINGDVNGDILFDPAALTNIDTTGTGSTNTVGNNLTVNTADTNTTNAQINNNVNLSAQSGNATVADNTSGGNATSGNAQAVVNLMNLINSSVSAGQSFVGVININGDLNGDILLPQSLLDELLASTGPNSNNTVNNSLTDNSTVTNNTTEGITNNINSTAQSGNATVAGNTSAGGATSGSAMTNVTLLNLTGSNVVASNDILVFVNVLGQWVGMIMNAPAGATAAELGGGVSNSGPNSNNSVNNSAVDNASLTNNTTEGINNNVNVAAQSGNATVKGNTNAGNATSGNASTAVNVLNIAGSNLNLSNWFGILFINVFGIWNGSFGVNTSAGDPMNNPTENQVQAANQQSMVNSLHQFAGFVPHASNGGGSGGSSTSGTTGDSGILGSATAVARKVATDTATPTPDNATHASYLLPIVGGSLALVILVAGERDRLFHRK